MLASPAAGALGDSARTALLAAMLAVVVGVLIAWIASARRKRRRPLPPPPPVHVPPLQPSVLTPYVAAAPVEKTLDPDAIHLNSASYEELRELDGVDAVLAARILAYRRANGNFASLDELRELTGLAPERLEASDGRRLVL